LSVTNSIFNYLWKITISIL